MDAEAGKAGKCCCDKPTHRRSGEASEAHAEPVGTSALSTFSAPWIVGRLTTAVGEVPQVATSLTWRDRLGAWRVRWAIGRMRYRIPAGLYAVGNPNDESPVLVTANYKLTFDRLRSQMAGRDAWILVLDTKGVNVWCAAAKGTFGTDELVHRIEATRVASVVSHDMLILPQLAAVGVTAHEVHKRSGFRVDVRPGLCLGRSRLPRCRLQVLRDAIREVSATGSPCVGARRVGAVGQEGADRGRLPPASGRIGIGRILVGSGHERGSSFGGAILWRLRWQRQSSALHYYPGCLDELFPRRDCAWAARCWWRCPWRG